MLLSQVSANEEDIDKLMHFLGALDERVNHSVMSSNFYTELGQWVVWNLDKVSDHLEAVKPNLEDHKMYAAGRIESVDAKAFFVGAKEEDELVYEDLRLNFATREVYRGERKLKISKTKFDILAYFMRYPKRSLPHRAIMNEIWGYDYSNIKNEHFYIYLLNKELEAGGEPKIIHSVWGTGYILELR